MDRLCTHAIGVLDHASIQSVDAAPARTAAGFRQWTNGRFEFTAIGGVDGHVKEIQGLTDAVGRVEEAAAETALAAALDKAFAGRLELVVTLGRDHAVG